MLLALSFIGLVCGLAYFRASLGTFSFILCVFMLSTTFTGELSPWYWLLFLSVFIPLNFRTLRRILLTAPLFKLLKHRLPNLDNLEKLTLHSGSSWWEAELFRGAPDWQRLHNYPAPRLSPQEQAFLDGPVQNLCQLIEPWKINHQDHDLSAETWDYIKQAGFFALLIEKKYGGHGFSAFALNCILQKIGSFSPVLANTISAPNSLGPSSLIQGYGSKEQKQHYLSKIASGKLIPCLALSSVEAGSDINAITDEGVVCQKEVNGQTCIGIKLSWHKRYVTLAPIANLIALAFQLKDPEQLLGNTYNIGISCALIPSDLKGVSLGRRHQALHTDFLSGPCSGKEVFITIDSLIGGAKQAGKAWNMLIETLNHGRAINIPACSTGCSKMAALSSGAYSRIRHQFKRAIAQHQGIEEPLAKLGANAYLMDSVTRLTVTAFDMGESPSVISAIVKYHLSHRAQQCLIAAMDIHGGKAICQGPNNYLAQFYCNAPIANTVEGSNIITRNLIIYGQGAIRSHPYLQEELLAAQMKDPNKALGKFDQVIFSHIGYGFSNFVRCLCFAFTDARFIVPPFKDQSARYYQQLTRYSTYLALLSDIIIAIEAGKLKHKERVSARLGDILSHLYLASAILKHFEDEGRTKEDSPFMHVAVCDCIQQIEQAYADLLANFPSKILKVFLKPLLFPLGRPSSTSCDIQEHKVAHLLSGHNEARSRMASLCYLHKAPNNPAAYLEQALMLVQKAEPLVDRVSKIINQDLAFRQLDLIAEKGLKLGIITSEEAKLLQDAETARLKVINVDDFEA